MKFINKNETDIKNLKNSNSRYRSNHLYNFYEQQAQPIVEILELPFTSNLIESQILYKMVRF
jgi:hypothetical protein